MPSRFSRARNKAAEMELAKANQGKRSVIDASGAIVGRLGTHVAKRLLHGESIVILNSEKAILSGSEESIKARFRFKTEVGSRRKGPFPSRMPHLLLKRSIRGMLPRDRPNGRDAFKRLICHIGVPPEFKDAKPETVEGAVKTLGRGGMTLLEVSRFLGKHIEVTHPGS